MKKLPVGYGLNLADLSIADRIPVVSQIIMLYADEYHHGMVDVFSDLEVLPEDVQEASDQLRLLSKPGRSLVRRRPTPPTFMGVEVDLLGPKYKSSFLSFAPYAIYAIAYDSLGRRVVSCDDTGAGVFVSNRGDSSASPPPIQLPTGLTFKIVERDWSDSLDQ